MRHIQPRPLLYRSLFARIILLTLETSLSQDILNAVLYSAGLHRYINRYPPASHHPSVPATDIQALFAALESLHNPEETCRLAHLCGQAIARYLLGTPQDRQPDQPRLPMQAIPLPARQLAGLRILNDLLGEFDTGHHLHITPESSGYLLVLETASSPSAALHHLMFGFLVEGMRIFTLGEREYGALLTRVSEYKTQLVLRSLVS